MASKRTIEALRRKIEANHQRIDTIHAETADLKKKLAGAVCPFAVGDALQVPIGHLRGLSMRVVDVDYPTIESRGEWMVLGQIIKSRSGKPSLYEPVWYTEQDFSNAEQ